MQLKIKKLGLFLITDRCRMDCRLAKENAPFDRGVSTSHKFKKPAP
jgi:hypothetical protein